MTFRFAKYQGLGNDFVLLSDEEAARAGLRDEDVATLCDRHRGIGADGVIVWNGSHDPPEMRIVNADGSEPEMCGNGLRCVALELRRKRVTARNKFVVGTRSGPHECEIDEDQTFVRVQMRAPTFAPADVPVDSREPVVDASWTVGGRSLHVTAVSMGNPHAVIFDDVGAERFELGPAIAADPRFTAGVNVGFARIVSESLLELAVLERGVGWTQACGTGACAAVAAAVETGRLTRGRAVRVKLDGGVLEITIGAPGERVSMSGPARHVFDGETSLANLKGRDE